MLGYLPSRDNNGKTKTNIRTKDFSERIFQVVEVVEVEKQNLYTAEKKQQVDTLTGLSQIRLEQHDGKNTKAYARIHSGPSQQKVDSTMKSRIFNYGIFRITG